jgi:Fic family protein
VANIASSCQWQAPQALSKLEHYYDIELTYTSNAIEGNTLSAVETAIVIEQGVTIGGKPLKDHLEALDHYDAIRYVRELARKQLAPLTELDVRNLHSLVVKRSRPDIAGRYADLARYVRTETGRHMFPSPAEIPALMGDFAVWLRSAPDTPDTSFTPRSPCAPKIAQPTFSPCNRLKPAKARMLLTLSSTAAWTQLWTNI